MVEAEPEEADYIWILQLFPRDRIGGQSLKAQTENDVGKRQFGEGKRRTHLKASKFLIRPGLMVLTTTGFPSIDHWGVLDTFSVAEEATSCLVRLLWGIK